jgi:hypothetical protein
MTLLTVGGLLDAGQHVDEGGYVPDAQVAVAIDIGL